MTESFAKAVHRHPVNELQKASMVACVICDNCAPCVIADQMLRH